MEHVFLSYSRKDEDFVRRLHEGLEAEGRETWADWEGIPPSDEWMARIHAAIDEAEAIVFVISPDSLTSEVCGEELDYAIQAHKRIIPVVWREPDGPVRDELSKLNWIFARPDDPFEPAVETLLQAVDTDLDWVKAHTRLNVRAREWDRFGREASYTLRGKDLTEFEDWAARAPDKDPKPTVMQSEYLLASRRGVTRRQRITWTAVTGGLCVAMVLGTLAWLQSEERARQAEIAGARQLLSKAEALREIPAEADEAYLRHGESLQAATAALATLHRVGESVYDADRSLRKSLSQISTWQDIGRSDLTALASAFTPDGRRLAVLTKLRAITLVDTVASKIVSTCQPDWPENQIISQDLLAISADGELVGLGMAGGTNKASWEKFLVWRLRDCSLIAQYEREIDGRLTLQGVALNAAGSRMIYWHPGQVTAWDVAADTQTPLVVNPSLRLLALSPDEQSMFAYIKAKGDKTRWLRIFDLASGVERAAWTSPHRPQSIYWTTGGLVMSAGDSHAIYTADGNLVGTLAVKSDGRTALSPDAKKLAVVAHDDTIEVYGVPDGRLLAKTHRPAKFENLTFTPDGRAVVAVSNYKVGAAIWHIDPPGPYTSLKVEGAPERLWFADDAATLHLADGAGEAVWRLPGAGEFSSPTLVANSLSADKRPQLSTPSDPPLSDQGRDVLAEARGLPDRKALLVCGEWLRAGCVRHLEIWEDGEKRADREYNAVFDTDRAGFLQFANRDRYLIVGTATGLEVLDWATLEPVAELFHAGAVRAELQADGRRAATIQRDNVIRVWNLESGQELNRIEVDAPVRAFALSNDNRWLAVLAANGDIMLWATGADDLIHQTCRWLEDPCP